MRPLKRNPMSKVERTDLDACDEDIANLYLKTATLQIKRMVSAAHSQSMAMVQRLAHKLAGSSGFLELKNLAKLLRQLEEAAERKEPKDVSRLLALVQEEFDLIQRHRTAYTSPVVKSRTPRPPPPPKSTKKFKIFIVDDHSLIREGLGRLINLQPDLSVCGEATTAHQALKAIPSLKPDIVILDITLAGSNGMDLIKDMKLRSLKSFVLVLSMHDESLYAERALRAGAKGYIMKEQASKEILTAIHRILSGEIYLGEKMAAKMLHKMAGGQSDA